MSIVLENEKINPEVIKSLDAPEQSLLSWYLYAYGNACSNNSSKIKCQILKELNVNDECSPDHLNKLLQWFAKDLLAPYKLKKCPNIPSNSAIQNTFHKVVIIRKGDTLSIDYHIMGMNNSQEKSWNFDAVDTYIIEGKHLVKL